MGGNADEWISSLDEEATAEGIPVNIKTTEARAILTITSERRRITVRMDIAFRVSVVMSNCLVRPG
jgi:hypothetical protein